MGTWAYFNRCINMQYAIRNMQYAGQVLQRCDKGQGYIGLVQAVILISTTRLSTLACQYGCFFQSAGCLKGGVHCGRDIMLVQPCTHAVNQANQANQVSVDAGPWARVQQRSSTALQQAAQKQMCSSHACMLFIVHPASPPFVASLNCTTIPSHSVSTVLHTSKQVGMKAGKVTR